MKKAALLVVLVVALVFGVASAAFGAASTFGPQSTFPLNNSGTPVNVRATVNPRVQMTITCPDATQTVDFGTLNPGDTAAAKNVTVNVLCNQAYHLQKSVATPASLTKLNVSMTYADGSSTLGTVVAAPGTTFTDAYSIGGAGVPWDTAPAQYATAVTYTVVTP